MSAPVKPTFVWEELLDVAGRIVTYSSQEVTQPAVYLLQNWVGKPWHSVHESFEFTASLNDRIRFRYQDGGHAAADYSADMPDMQDWGETAASELEDAMNSAVGVSTISVTYDVDAGEFTISTTGTLLTLYCSTQMTSGTHGPRSAYPSFGFDCSSDKTGALTYTSTHPVFSTGGTFYIVSGNKTWKIDSGSGTVTATLTEAQYNRGQLLTQLIYQSFTAASITNYDASFDESSLKWTTKRASGTYSIIQSGNTFGAVIGYTFGGGNYTAATTYTAENRAIHTHEWVMVQIPNADGTDAIPYLLGHNFTSSAVVKFMAKTSTFDPVTGSPTYNKTITYNVDVLIPTSGNDIDADYTFFAFRVSDPTNEDGFVSAGIFRMRGFLEMENYETYQAEQGTVNKQTQLQSTGGQTASFEQADIDEPTYNFITLTPTFIDGSWRTFTKAIKASREFLFILDPVNKRTDALWCLFKGNIPIPKRDVGGTEDDDRGGANIGYSLQVTLMEQK